VYNLPHKEFGNLFPTVREYILSQFPQIINGSLFAFPTTRIQAFMNHSDTPNYDAQTDETLRYVKAGEEITEDYRKIPNAEKIFTFLNTSVV